MNLGLSCLLDSELLQVLELVGNWILRVEIRAFFMLTHHWGSVVEILTYSMPPLTILISKGVSSHCLTSPVSSVLLSSSTDLQFSGLGPVSFSLKVPYLTSIYSDKNSSKYYAVIPRGASSKFLERINFYKSYINIVINFFPKK